LQGVTPNLWFDNQAEEAVNFYISIFPNSKILATARYSEVATKVLGKPADSVMTIDFELDGQRLTAINGGPQYKFSPAISLLVNCDTQAEIDQLWDALSVDKSVEQCGWLKDRYGLSWQIVPSDIGKLMSDPDPVKVERVFREMLTMKKLDIERLRQAYRG